MEVVTIKIPVSPPLLAILVPELVAFLAFQRGQIPSPMPQLQEMTARQSFSGVEAKKSADVVASYERLSASIREIFLSPQEVPDGVAVALGQTTTTPKEVFVVWLRGELGGDTPTPFEPQAKDASRKILRSLLVASASLGDSSALGPTKLWLLFRGSREARFAHCVPKQTLSPDKPSSKKSVVALTVVHNAEGDCVFDGQSDRIWYQLEDSLVGFVMPS